MENPGLSWEKITIYNLGLDIGLWENKLYGEFDVFSRDRDGIAGYRSTSLPSTFGIAPPLENLNRMKTSGFEAMIGTANTWNEVKFDLSANLSYSRSKWNYYDEPKYTDPDQIRLYQRTGNWIDRTIGYRSDGLFTYQGEIDALEYDQDGNGNKTLRPGDIKLIDLNHDGKLDWRDQTFIGNGAIPHWMFGANVNIAYKKIDFYMLFQGAFGYAVYNNLMPGIGSTIGFENRWTEQNNDRNALVPRIGTIAGTNGWYSDYYLKTSNYLRLKTISIGYTLPKKWMTPAGIENLRIYFAGTNLFTIDKLKKFGVDPEVTTESIDQTMTAPSNDVQPQSRNGYYYPQQRTLTIGVNLSF